MYSPLVVGASNTHINMPINKSKTKSRGVSKDTLRTHIKEQLMTGAVGSAGTTVVSPTTGVDGVYNDQFFLAPLGLTAASLTTATWQNGTTNNVERPHLRKLNNLALDFRQYRVLGGKMVWIPGCSVTSTGQITMSSSADPFDAVNAAAVAYSSGDSYKTFNLSAGKECSIVLSVDSSWKKISSVLSCPMGSVFDGAATATNVVVNIANLDSLCFTALGVNVQGGVANQSIGTFRLEYEVEFRGLIDLAANA